MKRSAVRNKYGYRIKVSRKLYKHIMAGGPKHKRLRILGKVNPKWKVAAGEPVAITLTWDFTMQIIPVPETGELRIFNKE